MINTSLHQLQCKTHSENIDCALTTCQHMLSQYFMVFLSVSGTRSVELYEEDIKVDNGMVMGCSAVAWSSLL